MTGGIPRSDGTAPAPSTSPNRSASSLDAHEGRAPPNGSPDVGTTVRSVRRDFGECARMVASASMVAPIVPPHVTPRTCAGAKRLSSVGAHVDGLQRAVRLLAQGLLEAAVEVRRLLDGVQMFSTRALVSEPRRNPPVTARPLEIATDRRARDPDAKRLSQHVLHRRFLMVLVRNQVRDQRLTTRLAGIVRRAPVGCRRVGPLRACLFSHGGVRIRRGVSGLPTSSGQWRRAAPPQAPTAGRPQSGRPTAVAHIPVRS
jgi:hypothetical protein